MKYKMNMKPLYLSGILLLFAACGDTLDSPVPDNREQDVLRVLSVGAEEVATRSIVTTADLNTGGKQIGIYAVKTDGTEYIAPHGGGNTSTYQYDGSNWNSIVTDGSKLLRLPATGTVKAGAFYPHTLIPYYSSGNKSYVSGIHILSGDDFAATKQTDYLYSGFAGSLSTSNRSVAFSMKHALAKLTFKVYRKSVLDETKLVALHIIDAGGGSNLQGGSGKSMNLETGALQGLIGQSAIALTATSAQQQTINQEGGVAAMAYCLVAPAPAIEYLSFQLTTSRGTADSEQSFLTSSVKMVNVVKKAGEYLRWTAGSHYVFTIVLDGMKAGISDIQVSKWESDTDTYIPVS